MITIKDIAREAGVSHTAVSRALIGNPLIKPVTRECILRIASKMNYVPNYSAKNSRYLKNRAVLLQHRPRPLRQLPGRRHQRHPLGAGRELPSNGQRNRQRRKSGFGPSPPVRRRSGHEPERYEQQIHLPCQVCRHPSGRAQPPPRRSRDYECHGRRSPGCAGDGGLRPRNGTSPNCDY